MLPDKLSFVDIETTGTSARYGRIIEIGILRVEEGKIVKTFNTLLNPETHLPPEIEMLTGISTTMLENQPTFRQIKDEILEILIDSVFVAHNVRFDYSFLRHEFKRENIDFTCRHFCTVKLSRTLFPNEQRHNLDSIIERFGLECENRHRAFEDAKILWDFYQKTQQMFDTDSFQIAINTALRRPNIPTNLSAEILDNLPEQPGVYIFYGANGMPLYVGKSLDIKDRVLSHFSSDIENFKEMSIAQQVTSIETIVTAGELGALFLESSLIKSLLPVYNRMLRNKREMTALTKTTTKEGYETINIVPIPYFTNDNAANKPNLSQNENWIIAQIQEDLLLGIFKSRKEAKMYLTELVKEFKLCGKLLGLEKTTAACFGYRLGKCNGACINKENSLFYNLRFTTAFFKSKIKHWPYEGPIIIKETNDLTGIAEGFLIDKWCYLGKFKIDYENVQINTAGQISDMWIKDQIIDQSENDYNFDFDMYKLIYRFLNKTDNKNKIIQLKNSSAAKSNNASNVSSF